VPAVVDELAVVVRSRIGMDLVLAVRASQGILHRSLVRGIFHLGELVRSIDAGISRIAHWLFVFRPVVGIA
jgi:hypothetical protein